MSLLIDLHRLDSQVGVKYGESYGSDTYKLLEVDERLLQELLENGLTVKGRPEEEAVLCSSATTYAVKFVSTSNTTLLVPPIQSAVKAFSDCDQSSTFNGDFPVSEKTDATAVAAVTGHLELVETLPKVEDLKALLGLRPYKEDNDDAAMVEEGQGLFTWDDLLTVVQASESELKKALADVEAVKIGQYWRVLDSEFLHSILDILLLTARQHDWPLNALPEAELLQAMEADNFPPLVVLHCLQCFGFKSDAPSIQTLGADLEEALLGTKWALDEKKACLHFARRLLASTDKWRLDEFLESWRKSIPADMETNLRMLSGEVLLETVGSETWLHHFSVGALPRRPEDRFPVLFQRRSKWVWEDLEPYLRDLAEPNRSVEAMVLKFTRKTQPLAQLPPIYTLR